MSEISQVQTDIEQIQRIYSNAFKPFIKLIPERYINTDDLIQDLKVLVNKWDGHASFLTRKSLKDNSDYRINSYGKGYIFVSENTRVDIIYRFYNEIIKSGTSEITINLLALNDRQKYNQLISYLILPFIDVDLQVLSKSRTTGEIKTNFKFDAQTRVADFSIAIKQEEKTISIPKKIPGMKINIIFSDKVATLWYQRLCGATNFVFYCYSDCRICKGYYRTVYYSSNDKRSIECLIFAKILYSANEPNIPVIIAGLEKPLLPKSLRPMS